LVKHALKFAASPLAGTPRPQLAPDLRAPFKGRYAVYYMPRKDGITVLRVLHGARDLAAMADERGFTLDDEERGK
jgi:toxin ParE1/3/4